MDFYKELDARGLNCPLPILRTKKSLNDMVSGQILRVVATDPGSVKDFQAFSRQTGNELLSAETVESRGLFRPQEVRRIIDANQSGREDYSLQIFQLLTLELWQRQFMDG